ncbi:MAG: hypothetical protein Q9170_003687 [Blastenia crenularia]
MDEFAQTRTPEDLFDDDFIPDTEPIAQEVVQAPQPQLHRGRGDGPRGPGRGRGRPIQQQQQQQLRHTITQPSTTSPTETPSTIELPTAEPDSTPKPSTAVRGDRSATGGNAKPKLTEGELSAKLAAAKLNNAKREEAHRLAEADEASFQQREAQASQRRQEEGRARRLMDQEREKNRLRKLGAQGGREWDEGKEDQPVNDPRRSRYQRGAHGGTSGYQGAGNHTVDIQTNGYDDVGAREFGTTGGRGRGGRGRGRGGRGRGGSDGGIDKFTILQPPVPNAEADFPALPPAQLPKVDSVPQSRDEQRDQQPTTVTPASQPAADGGQSWADEVNAKAPSSEW